MIRTGKLYLVGFFLIGALSAAAGVNWLQQGEIVFRSEEAPGVERVARLDRSDPLFLPVAAAWFQLGSGVAALTVLSLFLRERAVERWAGYACIGLILLAVATALVSYGAAEDATSGVRPATSQDRQAADE